MVVPKIQQITTRSKGKQSKWEIQEAVRKATKEWVEHDTRQRENVESHDDRRPQYETVEASGSLIADCYIARKTVIMQINV